MTTAIDERLAIGGGTPTVTVAHPRQWPQIDPMTMARITALLATGELSDFEYGPVLRELEEKLAGYHGVRYALAVTSGTAALHSAYAGLGLRPGDEVIVPTYTFHATVSPLFLCGAVPVLCDADRVTGNLDPEDLKRRITARTRAIVVTHVWGHPAEMDEIMLIARGSDLAVVEDCSHAHGARYRGRLVGTFGDVGVFSMGASKMISGGMGGALISNRQDVFERAVLLGHCHERSEISVLMPAHRRRASFGYGANYRIGLFSAVMCLEQLRTLDQRIAHKTATLERLSALLTGIEGLRPPLTRPHVTRGGWYGYKAQYVSAELSGLPIDQFIRGLRAEGLRVARPSGRPLHLDDAFVTSSTDPSFYRPGRSRPLYKSGDFPGAEHYYDVAISFPAVLFHETFDELLTQYADGVRKVVRQHSTLL